MVDPVRHDWPTIIREIKARYGLRHKKKLTDYKLGLMIAGTDARTVKAWQKGTEPGHYQGELLMAYHAEFHSKGMETSTTPIGQSVLSRA